MGGGFVRHGGFSTRDSGAANGTGLTSLLTLPLERPRQAVLAEAEAADGERKSLGEQLTAAKKAAKELEKQVGGRWGNTPGVSLKRIRCANLGTRARGNAQHVESFNHPLRACCPATPQVAELAAVVAKVKAEYDDHDARLKERLDRLKVRGRWLHRGG